MNMKDEKQEMFRGHLEECLKHLSMAVASQAPPRSRKSAQLKKPIWEFCEVTLQTVKTWLEKSSVPTGSTLFKLMCYLDKSGYKVLELERMPRVRRFCVELIGYGVLDAAEAAKLVGYTQTSSLYQSLNGNEGVSKEKEEKMWNLWKEKREELERRKIGRLFPKESALEIPQKFQTPTPLPTLPAIQPHGSPGYFAVLNIMQGLLALLDAGLLDGFTDVEPANLQGSASNTILRLSGHLSTLSSKLTARISGQE